MRKALTALTLTALVGCSTTGDFEKNKGILVSKTDYQRPATQIDFAGITSGSELRRVTEQDQVYNLESHVINGERFYGVPNIAPEAGEGPIALIRFNEHTRDPRSGEITAPRVYVLEEIQDASGNPITTAPFTHEGRYAKKVEFTDFEIDNVEMGTIYESQWDARFNILTKTLAGEEWAIPTAPADRDSTTQLPFYFVHTESFKPLITPIMEKLADGTERFTGYGSITLQSTSGSEFPNIFRPTEESWEQWSARKAPIQPLPDTNNPGQLNLNEAIPFTSGTIKLPVNGLNSNTNEPGNPSTDPTAIFTPDFLKYPDRPDSGMMVDPMEWIINLDPTQKPKNNDLIIKKDLVDF